MPSHVERDLPMLPSSRIRALLLLHNPDATVPDFVRVFEADPALSVAALTAANSAASAPVRRIATVREAVVRIGAAQARHIAVSAIMRSQFDRSLEESWLEVGALWEHLVVVGLLTEVLAGGGEVPGTHFVAGYLHDVGRLALVAQNPFGYRRVIDMAKAGAPVAFAERRVFGINHETAGGRLAEKWGLPDEVAIAASAHHSSDGHPLANAVFHARRIAWKLGYGDGVTAPEEVVSDDETAPVLALFGGDEGLRERVRWHARAGGDEAAAVA